MPSDCSQNSDELSRLIKAVAGYGEQARLLALNLAVSAAKIKFSRRDKKRLNDDLFGLVTRMSTVAKQITEIAAVAEEGYDRGRFSESDRLLRLLLEKGIFNTDVVQHLERSVDEVRELAERIAEQIGVELPAPIAHESASEQ